MAASVLLDLLESRSPGGGVGVKWTEAEVLARAAHEEICPCSREMRGSIDVIIAAA